MDLRSNLYMLDSSAALECPTMLENRLNLVRRQIQCSSPTLLLGLDRFASVVNTRNPNKVWIYTVPMSSYHCVYFISQYVFYFPSCMGMGAKPFCGFVACCRLQMKNKIESEIMEVSYYLSHFEVLETLLILTELSFSPMRRTMLQPNRFLITCWGMLKRNWNSERSCERLQME